MINWFDLYVTTDKESMLEKEKNRIEQMPHGKEREDEMSSLRSVCREVLKMELERVMMK